MSDSKYDYINKSFLFFCFGIKIEDCKDDILIGIIKKAYLDATNQGAFNTKAGKEGINKDSRDVKRDELINTIICAFNKLIEMDSSDEFNDWHKSLCEKILKHYTNWPFTYGNAQKVVNMTMKYLLMLSIYEDSFKDDEIKRILEAVQKHKENLHVPIDSYIIDMIIKEGIILQEGEDLEKDFIWLQGKNFPKRKKIIEIDIPSNYLEGWSNWSSYDNYFNLQQKIRRHIASNSYPIKWESEQWIASAENRRKIEARKKSQ